MQGMSFGEWMKERRRVLNLTQLELADRVGCASETIQKLETGRRRPSGQMAELLADRLGLTGSERITFLDLARPGEELRRTDPFTHGGLPRQLTSFVGRELEVAEVVNLVETHYLVTLTGAGGVGKSRLAVAAAQELQQGFADALFFVDLAPISEPELVAQTVASALGLRERPGRGHVEAIQGYFRTRSALLVLDNCEHLLEACSSLADTCLRSCPQLHLLATGRQPLSLPYEVAWPVPPMALPESYTSTPGGVGVLAAYSAVELFVQRARSHLPGFALSEGNARRVIEVCTRLDGLPLAIELAAARVKVLSVEQIASRLDARFRLLTGGSLSLPPRQRTLRTTLDWSYQLLGAGERKLLNRLSVFAGSFTLEAVQAVCAEVGDEYETIDLLAGLVDKSLVVRPGNEGEPGYRLLESIQEYAWEKLQQDGEEAAMRDRHLTWCLLLAERAAPKLKGPEQLEWLARLGRENGDLQAALAWSLAEPGAARTGLRLATALGWFWQMRSYLIEGLSWFGRLLAAPENAERTALRCEALYQAGVLALEQHSLDVAGSMRDEALEIARELGDPLSTAGALRLAAMTADFSGDHAPLASLVPQIIEMFAELGRPWDVAWSMIGVAINRVWEGDLSSAAIQFEENHLLYNELGDEWAGAISLAYWGMVLYLQGFYEVARDKLEQGLATNEKFGDRSRAAWTALWLARCDLAQEQYQSASELYRRVLASYWVLGDRDFALRSVCGIGRALEERGNQRSATTIFAAVAALDPDRYPQGYLYDGAHTGTVQAGAPTPFVSVALGGPPTSGRARSLDDLVEYGLQVATDPGPGRYKPLSPYG